MTMRGAPVFIGGLAHSGKTQLRVVLGAHPGLSLTRRTYLWTRYFGRFGDLHADENLERCLDVLDADARVQQLEPDRARLRREFAEGPRRYARLFGLLHEHHAERMGKRRWGEQLGSIERFAAPIFAEFPEARMVHMIRDPRALARVSRATARKGKLGWETAMWLHSAELAEQNRRQYPERYRVVRYETLAERPLETLVELCAFLDEEVTPGMTAVLPTLSFHGDATWPDALERRASSFVEINAGRRLATFGYDRATSGLNLREHVRFLVADWPLNRTAMTAWRATRRRAFARQLEGVR